jgi:hypothetical protein
MQQGKCAMRSSTRWFAVVLAVAFVLTGCGGRDDYGQGKRYLDRGDFANAEIYLKRAADKNPQDVRPLKKLAQLYAREEKYDEAAKMLEKARAVAPTDPEILGRLAHLMAKAGKPSEALVVAQEALQLETVQKDKDTRQKLEQLVADLEKTVSHEGDAQKQENRNATQASDDESSPTRNEKGTTTGLVGGISPCTPLPTPPIRREDLVKLVPDNSPGKVVIRWRTETQEENLGFNIYRSENPDGPYERINEALIPGEGSTNIPKDYCYEDKPLPRGKVFYYYIETVSTAGVREILEGTKGTRVKVKTVEEEREWLWRKVMGGDQPTTQVLSPKPTRRLQATTAPHSTVARFTINLDTTSTQAAVNDPIY